MRNELAVADLHDAVDHLVQQVTIVGDEEDRPFVLRQDILHRLAGRNVQVVRRLIQDQEVGVLSHHLRQLEPVALAAGKNANQLVEVVGTEQELRQQVVGAGSRDPAGREQLVQDRPAIVQHLLFLRAVADAEARADANRLVIPSAMLDDVTHQRRLAAAVRAHQGDTLAAGDVELGVLEESQFPEGLAVRSDLQRDIGLARFR